MSRNSSTYSVGRLPVNPFLMSKNGVGFMSISDIPVIMNLSILSKAVIGADK